MPSRLLLLLAQLSPHQHGGAALGGLLLTWWLASRLFAATSRALDTAYQERHRRQTFNQRLIALAFFSSVAILLGNELNAELARLRRLGGQR